MPRRESREVRVDPSFGPRLRQLREQRGLSLAALASRVYASKSLLGHVETGCRAPTVALAVRLDKVLDASGRLARLVTVEPPDVDGERLRWAARHPRQIDQETIDALARILAAQRRLEDSVGSAATLGPAAGQAEATLAMLRETTGPLRRPLAALAGQWCQWLGWLHMAAGNHISAEDWLGEALQLAVEAGDVDLVATVLSFRGHLAWTAGEVPTMVGLTEAALRQPRVYVGQRAYDMLQVARGFAVAGDRAEVASLVAGSRDLTFETEAYDGEVPPWHYYRTAAFFGLERGRVYGLLAARDNRAAARQAVQELRAGLGGLPADMRWTEWVGEFLLDLAAAHARDGDLVEAARVLDEVDAVGEATCAGKLVRRAGGLRHALQLTN